MMRVLFAVLLILVPVRVTQGEVAGVLIPAYANPAFSPDGPDMWDSLVITAERADRSFRVRAVLNPDNGPGRDLAVQQARLIEYFGSNGSGYAAQFRAAGGTIAGYVWTDRGRVPLATVYSHIDAYMAGVFVGNIDGIFLDDFFDGVQNTDGSTDLQYYSAIYTYVQLNYPHAFIIGNVGNVGGINALSQSDALTLIGPLDTLVSHEMDRSNYENNYLPSDEVCSFIDNKFATLVHNSGTIWDSSLLSLANQRDCGWFYATPDFGANPWDNFDPVFWTAFTNSVNANPAPQVKVIEVNEGQTTRSQLTSVSVTFDTDIDPATVQNAFSITNIDNGLSVGTVSVSSNCVAGKSVAVLTFDGRSTVSRQGTGGLANSLADGNYKLEIDASKVVSLVSGRSMSANIVFGNQLASAPDNDQFYRLLGDANADGVRNGIDLNAIIPSLFNPTQYREDMDTNGDGVINGIDLNALIPTLFGTGRP